MQNRLYYRIFIGIMAVILLFAFVGCGTKEKETIPADGTYSAQVVLGGGSGKATVTSPALVSISDGKITAKIEWSSPYYDYMIIDETTYYNESEPGENSTFTIPVAAFDTEIAVIADTTAMSVPHEIEYTLTFTLRTQEYSEMVWESGLELSYATEFSVQKSGEYYLITIADSDRFLLIPENMPTPENVPDDVAVLQQPLDHVYLVSTSAFDLVREVGALDNVRLSGSKEKDLYISEATERLANGSMLYAGKYSAPDYELILSEGCDLAIENTMILHSPEVLDKLNDLGIPTLVERSSYEAHPLGRLEWIKLYGVLFNKVEEAKSFYSTQLALVEPIMEKEASGTSIAYFSLNTAGSVTVRKPGDYIAKMIELSGGSYALDSILVEEDNALSTMNMQLEDFYVAAKDADILIYNSTIEGEITSITDLLEKNSLFADFKAVQEGRVYCTTKNFFQESTGIGVFMEDLYLICQNDGNDELCYLIPLE